MPYQNHNPLGISKTSLRELSKHQPFICLLSVAVFLARLWDWSQHDIGLGLRVFEPNFGGGGKTALLQALNNWALVLQELATLQSPADQADLVQHSIFRFRQAIHLRPDFDRACYNLGTVFYAFACSQQSSLTQRLPSRVTQVGLVPSAEQEPIAGL